MADTIIHFFTNFDPYSATIFLSMIPLTELRLAIPAVYGVFDIPLWQIFFLSLFGNIIPAIILVYLLEPVSNFLRKHFKFFERFFTWLFDRTRKKFYNKHDKWGDIVLLLFVAIPIPITGVWTGSAAAFLFGVKKPKAILLMLGGITIAAIIVTLLTAGVFSLV